MAARKTVIKHINGSVKPKKLPDNGSYPILSHSPDIIRLIPNERREIPVGMEVATPAGNLLLTVMAIRGLIQPCQYHVGYQKELKLFVWNTTNSLIEISPGDHIADLYLTEIKQL